MFLLVNSVFMTLFTLILFYQIIFVYSQNNDYGSEEDDELPMRMPPSRPRFNSDHRIPEEYANTFNNLGPGSTLRWASLLKMISGNKRFDDRYEFKFRSDISNFLVDKLIIGQLTNLNQIIAAQISFHNEHGDFVRDSYNHPIIYRSTRQQIGHVLDILHQGFTFSYAKCLLQLQPNSDFDLHSLFFHFTHPSPILGNQMGIINGSNSFPVDSIEQMFTVSVDCPSGLTCMWLLDNAVISMTSNTSIVLTFRQQDIGNRTLSYVAYCRNNPRIIASLLLSILPSIRRVCNNLQSSVRNRWIPVGDMSSPRVYFTVTRLLQSGYLVIAGGTADGSNALSSIDIYDPTSGCFNKSNMTYPRMKHAAVYYNNSDVVFLIGGMRRQGNLTRESEFISLNTVQLHQIMARPRYSHEIAIVGESDILIVGGRGFTDDVGQIEIYRREISAFEPVEFSHPMLANLEGHSATTTPLHTDFAYIFGGYNGTVYSKMILFTDGTQFHTNNGTDAQNVTVLINERAHHQTTYIPLTSAILITGGDNGQHTFSTCFLMPNGTSYSIISMNQNRSYHAAVTLSNGSVLIIGGAVTVVDNQPSNPIAVVERYDPLLNTFTRVADLNVARYKHKAIYSPDSDEVFVFGGIGRSGNILSSFEVIRL